MEQIHGLHNFSGADWVDKFAGISKKLKRFKNLGNVPIGEEHLLLCNIPATFTTRNIHMQLSIRKFQNIRTPNPDLPPIRLSRYSK